MAAASVLLPAVEVQVTRTKLRTNSLRNLSKRPLKPAKGMGRVQRSVRRCLLVNSGVCTTSEALSWAYSKRLLMGGEKRNNDMNGTVRDALISIGARKVERTGAHGRPWLWALAHAHVDNSPDRVPNRHG